MVNGGTLTVSGATSLNDSASDFAESSGSVTFQSSIAYSTTGDNGAYDITGGTFSAVTVNMSRNQANSTAPTASAPVSANTGTGLYVNGSSAVVDLGTFNIGTAADNSSAVSRVDAGTVTVTNEVMIATPSRVSVLQVNGGSLNSLDSVNGIVIAPNNGTTSAATSELYLSGGTVTANRIAFGASADTVGGTGWVFVNGGSTLYVGAGGIVKPNTHSFSANIALTQGFLGATANWSSSLAMILNGTSFTIQTADASSNPWNIGLSGVISGAGALNVTGGGILTLGGVNTYTGATTVNGGTLAVTGSLASGSAVTVNSGATITGSGTVNGTLTLASGALASLTPNSPLQVVGAVTLNGNTVTVNVPGSALTYGNYNLLTAAGGFGSSTVNPTPSYTGNGVAAGFVGTVVINGNTLQLQVTSSNPLNTWTDGDSTGNWSDALNWSLGVAPQNPGDTADLGTGAGPVTLDANEAVGLLIFNNAASYTISGANTLTLNNSGNGALVSVSAGNANTIGTPVSLGDTATLAVGGGDSLTLSGTIANASTPETLTLNGPGTNILTAANTYGPAAAGTVGTTINSGVVQVGNSGALGAGDVAVTAGSTLQAGALGLTLNNNLITSSGVTLTANNNGLNFSGNLFTLGGVISGSGNLLSLGAGTNVLSGNNTFTGNTTLTNGTLQLANANAVKGQLNLASGTTLQLRGDVNTTFAPAGLTIQTNLAGNATDVFNLDAGPVTTGVTGKTLTLNGAFNNGTNDNTTINVTGNSTYTLALGNFVSGNTGHNPEYLSAFNAVPGGASLSIAQILTGNWSQWLNFQGGGNITLAGSLTNVSQGSAIVYVTGGTTLTMQGRSSLWASATGVTDGYRYDVANGTLVLDNSYALTNNTTGAAGVPSYFILGAATNLYYVASSISPPAGVLVNLNNSYNAAVYLGDATHATGGLFVGATVTNWVADGDANFANSGVMTIGGQNTSGINTYNNPVILGWNANKGMGATLVAATGGEVDFAGQIRANGSDTTAGITVGNASFGGTVKLLAANTFAGPTVINNGTLALGSAASLMASSSVTIAPGAIFDVSAQSAYALGSSASLTATGTQGHQAAINGASGGTVNLGARPITLNYDGGDPVLTSSQGVLTLGGNVLTVNGATLGSGTYVLISASGPGSISGTIASVNGTAIPTSGYTVSVVVTGGIGGNLSLQIIENTSTALALTTGTSPSTYGTALTYTATVSSLAGTPTTPGGNVVFQDGATVLATVPLTAGTASYTAYTALAAGADSLAAYYQGDSTHAVSSSSASPLAQSITPKPLSVTGLTVPASKPYDGTTATATPAGVAVLSGTPEAPGTGNAADGNLYLGDTVNVIGTPVGVYNSATVAGATR